MKLVATVALSFALTGLGLGLGACRGYQPGSFAYHGVPFPGQRLALDCVDVAIAANRDDVAKGAIARFSLANRCDAATPVDFTRLVVTHRAGTERGSPLAPTDPRGELRPVMLEARSIATEYLEFKLAGPVGGALCFELKEMLATALSGSETEVCLPVRTAQVSR